MTLIGVTYCTREDVERKISAAAVQAFSDHTPLGTADVNVVDDAINEASQIVEMYLIEGYEQTDLQQSPLVNRWCTTVAARTLMQTRGNPIPTSLESQYDEIMSSPGGWLEQIAQRKRDLPGIARRVGFSFTFANLQVDRRFRHNTIRRTPSNSTDNNTSLRRDNVIDIATPYAR